MTQFLIALVVAAPEPVRISTGQEPVPVVPSGPNYFAWLSGLCLVASIALVFILVRRAKKRPLEDRAFTQLARSLHLTSADRRLLTKMSAIEGQTSPLAMLVSPSAFTRCLESMESQLIGGDRAAIKALAAKLR